MNLSRIAIAMAAWLTLTSLVWAQAAGEGREAALPPAAPNVQPSAADLVRGQQVVVHKCVECHNLKRVFRATYDREGWNEAITRMVGQGLEITDRERWEAVHYLASQDKPPTVTERIGKLHFALVHFPIALILAVGFLDSLALARERKLANGSVGLLLWMTSLATTAAMLTGLRRVDPWATLAPQLEWHETAGFATFTLILLAAGLRQYYMRNPGRGLLMFYLFVLVAASIVTLVTGHLGGTVVHG